MDMSMDDLNKAYEQVKAENEATEKALDSLAKYTKMEQDKIDAMMYASPGGIIWADNPADPLAQLTFPNLVTAGAYTTGAQVATNVVYHEGLRKVSDRQEHDKKLHTKLFIHFAELFVLKNPKWQLQPEPSDPFHKVKLVRPDIGASITNMWPDNSLAVYGGPDEWTKSRRVPMESLPVALITTQDFYGWAIDHDVPEWVK